jgi:hypothetical protein
MESPFGITVVVLEATNHGQPSVLNAYRRNVLTCWGPELQAEFEKSIDQLGYSARMVSSM